MYLGDKNPNWKGGKPEHTCRVCGITYYSYAKVTSCCSIKCASRLGIIAQYGVGYTPKVKEKKEKPLQYSQLYKATKCGHYTKKSRSYCASCLKQIMSNKKVTIHCKICELPMLVYISEVKKKSTCSPECSSKYRSSYQIGSKSHKWLGGRASADTIQRGRKEYDNWRRSVFSRDDYTCVLCGKKGGRLCADHIKPWCLYPALRYETNNGRTLCFECHANQETTGWRMTNKLYAEKKKHGGIQYKLL